MPYKLAFFQVLALAVWNGASAPTPNPVLATAPTASPFSVSTCDDELLNATQCVARVLDVDLPLTSLACTACQDRYVDDPATALAIVKASCDAMALRSAVTEQLLLCQAECFPPDYNCSDVNLEASVCAVVESVADAAAEQSVQCDVSTSGALRQWSFSHGLVAVAWLLVQISF